MATSNTVFTTETSFCSDVFVTIPFMTIVVDCTPFSSTFLWRTGFTIVQVAWAKERDEITCVMSLPSGTTPSNRAREPTMDGVVDKVVDEAVETQSIADDDPHVAALRLGEVAVARQHYA